MEKYIEIMKYSIYIVPIVIMILESIFVQDKTRRIIRVITSIEVALILVLMTIIIEETNYVNLNGHLIKDGTIEVFEIILIIVTLVIILLMRESIEKGKKIKITEEIIILIYTSVIGMIISMEAHNLMTLFLSLEISSICFYIIALRKNSSRKSMEGGLKYFIIGGIVSTIVLLGIVNIYKETGSLMYSDIGLLIKENIEIGRRIEIGIMLIVVGLLIKLGIAPFYGWLIDAYEGAGMLNTLLLTITQKIVTIIVLINIYEMIVKEIVMEKVEIMLIIGIISTLIIGTMGSLRQEKIIRFVGYSAIVNSGLLIMFWIGGNIEELLEYSIFYLINYAIGLITLFAIIIGLRKNENDEEIEMLNDLKNIWKKNKIIGIALIIVLLNLAGLPPFTNFISKLVLILPIMLEGRIVMGMLILFLTVGLMIYYVNIIRIILIEKKQKERINIKTKMKSTKIMLGIMWIVVAQLYTDEIINIIKIIITRT